MFKRSCLLAFLGLLVAVANIASQSTVSVSRHIDQVTVRVAIGRQGLLKIRYDYWVDSAVSNPTTELLAASFAESR